MATLSNIRPNARPNNPYFSSGPCTKHPGWKLENLKNALLGRSHRSGVGKARLKRAIELTREILGVPANYKIGIVPASDTGAVEMALWSMLGARKVDVLAWETFGGHWITDIVEQLKLKDARVFTADYGQIPDLAAVDFSRDVVFTWNGTTAGARVPNGDWIKADREGLTICDATSAAFAQHLPFDKLDVTTFSWQKVLGSEAAHGMLILSPRAVQRLENYTPAWPLPKLFRMTEDGKFNEGIFEGETINTPSMLCVEDYLNALEWVKSIGGNKAAMKRADSNLAALERWVEKTPWVEFLTEDKSIRSNTSLCITVVDPAYLSMSPKEKFNFIRGMTALLEKEEAAYDIAGHRDAPPHIRIWGGATVETSDIEALLPWLDWAFAESKASLAKAA